MDVRELIERLQLAPHPEGGWYRETWRSTASVGERSAGSAIFFLLETGQQSQWHQVDADEFWLWHAGSELELGIAAADGSTAKRLNLGPEVLAGEEPQLMIPAGQWQTARASRGWALVSCLVVPGFDFSGFKLASLEMAARLEAAIL